MGVDVGCKRYDVERKGVNGYMCIGYEGRSVIKGRVKDVHVHHLVMCEWVYGRAVVQCVRLGGSGQRKKADKTANLHILRCLTQPGLGKFADACAK